MTKSCLPKVCLTAVGLAGSSRCERTAPLKTINTDLDAASSLESASGPRSENGTGARCEEFERAGAEQGIAVWHSGLATKHTALPPQARLQGSRRQRRFFLGVRHDRQSRRNRHSGRRSASAHSCVGPVRSRSRACRLCRSSARLMPARASWRQLMAMAH